LLAEEFVHQKIIFVIEFIYRHGTDFGQLIVIIASVGREIIFD
jgi:hypothetical protein